MFVFFPRGLVAHRKNVIEDRKKVMRGGGKDHLAVSSSTPSPSTSPGHTPSHSQVARVASAGTQSPTKTPSSPRTRRTAPPPPTGGSGGAVRNRGLKSTRPVSMWAGAEHPDYTKHNERRTAPEPPRRRASESRDTQQLNNDLGQRSPSGSTGSSSGSRTLSQERLMVRSATISYPDRTTRTVISSSEVATENGGIGLSSFTSFLPQPTISPQTRWSGTGQTRRSSSIPGGSPVRVLSNVQLSPTSPRRSSIPTDSPQMVRQRSRSSSISGLTPPGSPRKHRSASNSPQVVRRAGSRHGSLDGSPSGVTPRVELPASFMASDGNDMVETVRVR